MMATKTRTPGSRSPTPRRRRFAGTHVVQLTNLDKVFWPELGLTKRDLLRYYADVSTALLPHLEDRAMVMKRSGW